MQLLRLIASLVKTKNSSHIPGDYVFLLGFEVSLLLRKIHFVISYLQPTLALLPKLYLPSHFAYQTFRLC